MGDYTAYIWIVLMIALFYFMLIRPQKKKEKADRMLRNSLKPGDLIVTIGGFTGRVLNVKDDLVTFETGADRTKLTVKKWAIQMKESPESENKAEEAAEKTEKIAEKAEKPEKTEKSE